jgi:tripartite-type tricarboxylate transporter receptor subunit TctC
MLKRTYFITIFFAITWLGIAPQEAFLQQKDVASFYKGKTITFIVPYSPGGGYDLCARAMVPALKEYTGANVVVTNIPGAGGLAGGAHLYKIAKPDGLTIAILSPAGMIVAEMLDLEGVRYEMVNFSYIGRVITGARVLYAGKVSGFKTIQDMKKAPKTIRFSCVDPTSMSSVDAAVLIEALGLKGKIVPGYKGSAEATLAMIAGREIDAMTGTFQAARDVPRMEAGDITLVASLGKARLPKFPSVAAALETPGLTVEAKNLLELISYINESGWAIAAPPGTPKDRVLFLEKALLANMKGPAFINYAHREDFDISFLSGEELKAIVTKIMTSVPPAERPKFKHMIMKKYF